MAKCWRQARPIALDRLWSQAMGTKKQMHETGCLSDKVTKNSKTAPSSQMEHIVSLRAFLIQ